MFISKTRKWGNSVGIRIPKDQLLKYNINPNEELKIEIQKTTNPLEELWGMGERTGVHITQKKVIKHKKELESRWM